MLPALLATDARATPWLLRAIGQSPKGNHRASKKHLHIANVPASALGKCTSDLVEWANQPQ
jgi:hypothetical protein